jgi:hypothetical protein
MAWVKVAAIDIYIYDLSILGFMMQHLGPTVFFKKQRLHSRIGWKDTVESGWRETSNFLHLFLIR